MFGRSAEPAYDAVKAKKHKVRTYFFIYLSTTRKSFLVSRLAGRLQKYYENQELKLPIFSLQKRIGLGEVGDAHFLGVPLQAFAGKLAGNHTEA